MRPSYVVVSYETFPVTFGMTYGSLFVASRTFDSISVKFMTATVHSQHSPSSTDMPHVNPPFCTFRTPALTSYSVRLLTVSRRLFQSMLAVCLVALFKDVEVVVRRRICGCGRGGCCGDQRRCLPCQVGDKDNYVSSYSIRAIWITSKICCNHAVTITYKSQVLADATSSVCWSLLLTARLMLLLADNSAPRTDTHH